MLHTLVFSAELILFCSNFIESVLATTLGDVRSEEDVSDEVSESGKVTIGSGVPISSRLLWLIKMFSKEQLLRKRLEKFLPIEDVVDVDVEVAVVYVDDEHKFFNSDKFDFNSFRSDFIDVVFTSAELEADDDDDDDDDDIWSRDVDDIRFDVLECT